MSLGFAGDDRAFSIFLSFCATALSQQQSRILVPWRKLPRQVRAPAARYQPFSRLLRSI
jgi:hypothetical protein